MQFSRNTGSKFEQIYKAAGLYVEAPCDMDKYLSKQKIAFAGRIKQKGKFGNGMQI